MEQVDFVIVNTENGKYYLYAESFCGYEFDTNASIFDADGYSTIEAAKTLIEQYNFKNVAIKKRFLTASIMSV